MRAKEAHVEMKHGMEGGELHKRALEAAKTTELTTSFRELTVSVRKPTALPCFSSEVISKPL